MTIATPGTWKSPITPDMLASAGVSLGFTQSFDTELYWDETRPDDNGRTVVVSQIQGDILPAPWSAVTRVYEMGGLSWLVGFWQGSGGLLFSEKSDQRLYWKADGGVPVAITPESPEGTLARYCDLIIRGKEVWCVREITTGHTTSRDLIAIIPNGEIRILESSSHFYAHLRLSPSGNQLAWISWEHPQMPWDGTELRIAQIDSDGKLQNLKVLAGSTSEAVNSPVWANEDLLYFVTDRTGWWNVWSKSMHGEIKQVFKDESEWAQPMWLVGTHLLRILPDGRLVGIHGSPANQYLAVGDPDSGLWVNCSSSLTNWAHLSVEHETIFAIGGSPTIPMAIVEFDANKPTNEKIIKQVSIPVKLEFLPIAEAITLPSKNGRKVHAFLSRATNPNFESAETPPLIVTVHGGPTANTSGVVTMRRAFFTSRGFNVVDIDYGGSTGYGRAYREALKGNWGVVDTEDILAVVAGLIANGVADPKKILIRGGSAGGFAVLNGLVHSDVFAAGANYYGVAELIALAEDTHDFESRYLDSLIGPYPERRDLYVKRSPLTHADNLTSPLIIFQGEDDLIVPPSQSRTFRDVLIRKNIKHKYFEFAGEAHGFRQNTTIRTCAIEELKFYGEVLGFELEI